MTDPITFWIPALPMRALSPNGGARSRRDPWAVSEAKLTLGDVAYHAVLAEFAPNIPAFPEPVRVTMTLYAAHGKKPKDGLYRPTDPGNIGGDILKPILDYALVRTQIIPNDDYTVIESVVLKVAHVQELAQEGIRIEIEVA